MSDIKIAYVVSDLKRVGPSNQTLNIIKNSKYRNSSIVITLFKENLNDTMKSEYEQNNIKIICLNLNRITFSINGIKKLIKVLNENEINLIHSYGIKPDFICNKVSKKININHVITLRNYPKEDILTRMKYLKGRIALYNHLRTLKKSKNIVCCSKTIYDLMKKDYPNKKFSYIQNGVDTSKYTSIKNDYKIKLREKYKFDVNKKIIISTGSFIPRKRIEETILGLKDNKDIIILLVGTGNLYQELKNKYSSYSNIIFFGKTNKIEELLQLSDYFISSSESEGLPNGVIEAISVKLPVILSDIPQHKEILDEIPEAGILYKLGDINDCKEKMNLLLKNNIINNKDIKETVFNMNKMSELYVSYYESL